LQWEDLLRINSPSPKAEIVSKLFFQSGQIHLCRVVLQWIENVYADFRIHDFFSLDEQDF
jgi:hypothetical protein